MLELGIDELTVVLQIPPDQIDKINPYNWTDTAEAIIETFEEKADFINVYGERTHEMKAPKGYSCAYTYGEHEHYLAVAYHPDWLRMGVCIKFSAKSLDYYCKKTGLQQPWEFLQKIQCPSYYTTRLSRVDLTADYIDEDLDVTAIYNDFMKKRVTLCKEYSKRNGSTELRRTNMNFQGLIKRDEVPTIYVGSRQSNSFMRIYDKKREQMERYGHQLDKAENCNNWVRFEGVFRNTYAHQLSDALLNVGSDDEYANLILNTMLQQYTFMYVDNKGKIDCPTEYTQMLIDMMYYKNYILKAPTSRSYELLGKLVYIFHGSGTPHTLHKVKEIWGDEALNELLDYIKGYLKEFVPNDDCRYWLRKNAKDYKLNFPNFKDFLREMQQRI